MDFQQLKTAIEDLEKKRVSLETEMTKQKARKEMYLQQLNKDFGITEEQIPVKLLELEKQQADYLKALEEAYVKLDAYVSELQKALANVK